MAYDAARTTAFVTGTEALVRLALIQAARDAAAGLKTGGFISGYRGSPLATYDFLLERARPQLEAAGIHFQPGLNEDLAATAVWGSQQIGLLPGSKHQGVFGLWYGKGPGVDRSLDAIKHANHYGVSPHGGVLALAGDDHGCVSSTLPHQSDLALMAALVPVVYPADVQDLLDLGVLGLAMSRYSGAWVGLKCVTDVVEGAATVDVAPDRIKIVAPAHELPAGGLHMRWPDDSHAAERRAATDRLDAVAAFARANPFDRLIMGAQSAPLGIIASGKAYADLRQAMEALGIDGAAAETLGLAVYKMGLVWPIEGEGVRRFAQGRQELLILEEKRPIIEDQIAVLFRNDDVRPRLVGKHDETGAALVPSYGELDADIVARILVARLARLGVDTSMLAGRSETVQASMTTGGAPGPVRAPFFCSGCPHNTSTVVPEGSRAVGGIGCHAMVLSDPARRTAFITHMGGEGAHWIGQQAFTHENHVFQNLGDGTYHHSGSLAVRAAVAAKANVTFKILYNDAIAMTGGQGFDGPLDAARITRQMASEGVAKIVVVADDPSKYPSGTEFAPGVSVRPRRDIELVQRELRDVPGVTVLVYDQVCAAENRRRRKRGLAVDPPVRAFINPAVCEGCGDCSVQSNCIAIKPLETDWGRKRAIDQSSCNKDLSCLKGFCPSFVTVHGGRPRRTAKRRLEASDIPAPPTISAVTSPVNILVAGIGGSGVLTLGAILGRAAHIQGLAATELDYTGLAQKNGAVMSHIRLAPRPDLLHATKIPPGSADVLLACDAVVATSRAALSRLSNGGTRTVLNATVQPTALFIKDRDAVLPEQRMQELLASNAIESATVPAASLAVRLLGDAILANMLMLGWAWQKGWIPLELTAIETAIEQNGAAIDDNKQAFAWGRRLAHDAPSVFAILDAASEPEGPLPADTLIERRIAFLTAYQNRSYAEDYRRFTAKVAGEEKKRLGAVGPITEAVAANLAKLMAYKDEYEVARLYSDGTFKAQLDAQFEEVERVTYHLAPPILSDTDPVNGRPRKREFGPWMGSMFALLARLRWLRGTPLDPFGYSEERRMERGLVQEYRRAVTSALAILTPATEAQVLEIARAADAIRGFGPVKAAAVVAYRSRMAQLAATKADAPANRAAA
ncbi:indolepyruvate ferredoxin oxidoreductase family protein [Brevundimonas aurifodinae]|uniref:Indolepyruvate ferredoxin oxidoreductase family protein n=1 Tax=Brevundimonas aurifodinae TaxID=1508312 RepID=A0ABV1NL33_9CAUL